MYIYIYIFTRDNSALRARIGPWALVGPPLGSPLGPGPPPGPPLGPPLGPGGALRGSGPAGPWALVGPCGDRALREPSPGPTNT